MANIFGMPRVFGNTFGQGGSASQTYAQVIAGLSEPLWLRFRETSGTSIANSGTLGGAGTWTPGTGGALNQTGQLGAGEAYDFDGADSKAQFTNATFATIAALTTQRWRFLAKPDTLGENSQAPFFTYGTGFASHFLRLESSNRLVAQVDTDGTNAAVTTDINQISSAIGEWRWVFMDYDNADAMGLGRRIRLWLGTPGTETVTALTLGGGNTAAVGTVVAPSTDLVIGNTTGQIRTFDGLIDEVGAAGALWTPTSDPTDTSLMKQICRLSVPA